MFAQARASAGHHSLRREHHDGDRAVAPDTASHERSDSLLEVGLREPEQIRDHAQSPGAEGCSDRRGLDPARKGSCADRIIHMRDIEPARTVCKRSHGVPRGVVPCSPW